MRNRPTVLDQGALHSVVIDVFSWHWLSPSSTKPFSPEFHSKKSNTEPLQSAPLGASARMGSG